MPSRPIPNSRCKVFALSKVISSSCKLFCKLIRNDSCIRCAAFPVGAVKVIDKGGKLGSCFLLCSCSFCSVVTSFATVKVLPVPGPPIMILSACWLDFSMASCCIVLGLGDKPLSTSCDEDIPLNAATFLWAIFINCLANDCSAYHCRCSQTM